MKISKFKKLIDDLSSYYNKNFKVVEDDFDFCIENETKLLASISKSKTCLIITNYQDFLELEEGLRQALFDIIYKFAGTSIPEREDGCRNDTPCKAKEYTIDHCGTTFYISECPKCGCNLDGNQVQKYCHECGQRLEWEE